MWALDTAMLDSKHTFISQLLSSKQLTHQCLTQNQEYKGGCEYRNDEGLFKTVYI